MARSFDELIAHFRDLADPIAVDRAEVVRRNRKLGIAMLVHPQKAPKLARQVKKLSEKSMLSAQDATNMNAAARKRSRKMSAYSAIIQSNDIGQRAG